MLKTYTEIKVENFKDFALAIRNVIKWSMFGDENIIHFYQPEGVNQEMNIDTFKSYVIGSKVCEFEFDYWVEYLVFDPYKPLFLVACNTDSKTIVIRPEKVKMTKIDLASRLTFANEINITGFCKLRTKEQVINAYINNTCNKIMTVGI